MIMLTMSARLRSIAGGVIFFASAWSTQGADKREGDDKTAGPSSGISAPPAEQQQDAVLRLSERVEKAILEAGNFSSIAFVEELFMGNNNKEYMLIVTVGGNPKSKRSWEAVIHNTFVVVCSQDKTITVYDIDATIISRSVLYGNWLSDSNYLLPVGKGLTKLYETKPRQ